MTWHYQWMVLHDFVERVTEKGIVAKILDQGRRFYRFKKWPYMLVEFSAAAYRFGHSMVREIYSQHPASRRVAAFPPALDLLFRFTGLSVKIIGDLAPIWSCCCCRFRCYRATGLSTGVVIMRCSTVISAHLELLNASRKIDPFLIPNLQNRRDGDPSTFFCNLKRGVMLGLPSGQDVAKAMKIKICSPRPRLR